MGSAGEKRARKGGRREHLPKVGTSDELAEEQRLERKAVGDVLGLGSAPPWVTWLLLAAGSAVLIVAVVALVALD